jgi:hypothetical protein
MVLYKGREHKTTEELAKICSISKLTMHIIVSRPELYKFGIMIPSKITLSNGITRNKRLLVFDFCQEFTDALRHYFALRHDSFAMRQISREINKLYKEQQNEKDNSTSQESLG